jgi:hypothetical protein
MSVKRGFLIIYGYIILYFISISDYIYLFIDRFFFCDLLLQTRWWYLYKKSPIWMSKSVWQILRSGACSFKKICVLVNMIDPDKLYHVRFVQVNVPYSYTKKYLLPITSLTKEITNHLNFENILHVVIFFNYFVCVTLIIKPRVLSTPTRCSITEPQIHPQCCFNLYFCFCFKRMWLYLNILKCHLHLLFYEIPLNFLSCFPTK